MFRVGIPADSRQNETESRTCSKLFDTGSMSSHPHFKVAIMLGYEMDILQLRIERNFELLTMPGRDMLSVHPGMRRITRESQGTKS